MFSNPLDKRIKELTKNIEENPEDFRAYIDRGWAWQEKGNIEEAKKDMEMAKKILLNKKTKSFDN